MDFTVENVPLNSITPDLMRAGLALSGMVWPSREESLEQRVENALKEQFREETDAESQVVWHFVREGDAIIAMARTFRRVVAEESGQRFPILALAGVCTHSEHRNRGLGRAVVGAALSRVNAELPVCFFQTGVPTFYEKLGARLITNKVYNSTGDRRAFWDKYAMVYPAEAAWPDGAIDLLGGGW